MTFVRSGGSELRSTPHLPVEPVAKSRGPKRLGSIALALFVYAGPIKENPLLEWVPVDLTLLLGALLTVLVLAQILVDRFIPLAFWVPIGLVLLFTAGLLHPVVSNYGYDKMLSFGTLTLSGMLAAVVFLRDNRGRRVFLVSLAAIGAMAALLLMLFPTRTSEWSSVITLTGTNTISTSRMILGAALIVTISAILERRKWISVVVLIVIAGLLVLAAFFTGSRGPVIAAGISIVMAFLASSPFRRVRGRAVVVIALAATAGYLLLSRVDVAGLDRIAGFLAGDSDTSTLARSTFWRISWDHLLVNPLGIGWGGFAGLPATRGFAVEGRLYPHNVFFEIAVELGWLGLITLVALVTTSIVRLGMNASSSIDVALFAVFVFTLVNALVSGDINDNRMMWALLAAGFASQAGRKTVEPTGENDPHDDP